MANDYYGRDRDFIPFTRARGDDVQFELDALEAAFDKLPSESRVLSGNSNFVTAGGTANSITVSAPTTWTSYSGKDGYRLSIKITTANTGTVTLNVDGLGAKSCVRLDGDALAADDLQVNGIYDFFYNNTTGKFHVAAWNSFVTDAETAATNAATSETNAAASASSASSSASSASSSATTATNYATKTDGFASGTDNSSKSWAVGGTGDGQPSAGPAKDWAIKAEDSTVDGTNFSALHWSKKAEGWAASVNLPSITGNALKILRAKSDETGHEYVDPVWVSKAIGEPFGLRDDLAGVSAPPTDSAHFRYILLTAGEDGVGEYNEGVLISESISGSAPLVVATAVIDHADSPIDGETVNLWNTEGRYPRAGTSAGTVANDQMQQITGTLPRIGDNRVVNAQGTGAFSQGTGSDASPSQGTGNTGLNGSISFDSADSPDARTGTSTEVKHQQLTYYMRIV